MIKELENTLENASSPIARAERLKRIRNLAGLTREQLCENSKINIHTLIGWENGRFGGLSKFGARKVLERLAQEGVNCTLDWLLFEIGTAPSIHIGYQYATHSLHHENKLEQSNNEADMITEEFMLFQSRNKHATGFIVEDDGMLPQFSIGDYVAGNKRFKKEIAATIGLDCIVQLQNGELLLRRVNKGAQENTFTLTCTNPLSTVSEPVLYHAQLVSSAPVIWHRKKDRLTIET